jgi:hypothetical protein
MAENPMTLEAAMNELRTKPLIPLWPTTARICELSRAGVYDAANRGDFDVMEIGRLKKVVSASLRKRLGL